MSMAQRGGGGSVDEERGSGACHRRTSAGTSHRQLVPTVTSRNHQLVRSDITAPGRHQADIRCHHQALTYTSRRRHRQTTCDNVIISQHRSPVTKATARQLSPGNYHQSTSSVASNQHQHSPGPDTSHHHQSPPVITRYHS